MLAIYILAAIAACLVSFVVGFNLGCSFTQKGCRAQIDWLAKVRRKNNVVQIKRREGADEAG